MLTIVHNVLSKGFHQTFHTLYVLCTDICHHFQLYHLLYNILHFIVTNQFKFAYDNAI